jgi:large subunit ribosomal protein L13
METEMHRTYSPKAAEIERRWYVVDAAGVPLGRLSTVVARLLTGKHKPTYAPHLDTGDFVIVLNAEQTVLTGRKDETKVYFRHSGYPGGLKRETAGHLRRRRPERLVERAVRGMLPKNSVGRRQLRKLKVYAGGEHPHQAQQPVPFDLAAAS